MSVDTGNAILADDFQTVLVVSDLHLGHGQESATSRYDPRENFTADAAFSEFLAAHAEAAAETLLVLNGDVFDFIRITSRPATDDDFRQWADELEALDQPRPVEELRRLHDSETSYGLRTNDYKSVWKLGYIARGHPAFFRALADWNLAGGSIAFLKGNHDLELHWTLVQRATIREIARRAAADISDDRIRFVENFVQLANLYIEHGHRFESLTAVNGPPVLPGKNELHLPLGSFVNRYVINDLEGLEPNLDNLKPIDNLLWRLVRKHPLKIFRIIWRSLPLLGRAFRPYWWKHWLAFVFFFVTLLVPIFAAVIIVCTLAFPEFGDWIKGVLGLWRGPLGAIGVLWPYIAGFVRDVWPERKPKVGEDHFAEGVHEAMALRSFEKQYAVLYGVVGHTHHPDVQRLPPLHGADVLYLNSGTWIGTWSEDRPEHTGRVIKSFLRFDRRDEAYTHGHWQWDDAAGRALPSIIRKPT